MIIHAFIVHQLILSSFRNWLLRFFHREWDGIDFFTVQKNLYFVFANFFQDEVINITDDPQVLRSCHPGIFSWLDIYIQGDRFDDFFSVFTVDDFNDELVLTLVSFQRGDDGKLWKGNGKLMAGDTLKNADQVKIAVLRKEGFLAEMSEEDFNHGGGYGGYERYERYERYGGRGVGVDELFI